MKKLSIKDITGQSIEVTDLDAAIRQCRDNTGGRFKYEGTDLTQGDNNIFMLAQLLELRYEQRFGMLPLEVRTKVRAKKKLIKRELAEAINLIKSCIIIGIDRDFTQRGVMVEIFNYYYGLEIE